jgi:hypothetical protein
VDLGAMTQSYTSSSSVPNSECEQFEAFTNLLP